MIVIVIFIIIIIFFNPGSEHTWPGWRGRCPSSAQTQPLLSSAFLGLRYDNNGD